MAGLVAWLSGGILGLIAAILIIPATNFIYGQFDVSTGFAIHIVSPAYIGMFAATVLGSEFMHRRVKTLRQRVANLEAAHANLQHKLSAVQELGGIYHICSQCKSIQNESGKWQSVNSFLNEKTKMEFSHGICDKCAETYQEQEREMENKKN